MTVARNIVPHLPYLRRFARSLTGSQESGDAYVAAVLETLISDPHNLQPKLATRQALYGLFLKVWNSIALNGLKNGSESRENVLAAQRRLDQMTPLPRQAFLLVAVEGFTRDEAAEILDVAPSALEKLLDEAGSEIAEQMATRVLIIEDEPLIAMDIENTVESIGHVVQEIARTKSEAIAACKREAPGLVLADIQLADGSSGIDAVSEILRDHEVPVIFITAYPEQLLTGDRPEPTFLIPKPFERETVKAVISQALFFDFKAKSRKAA